MAMSITKRCSLHMYINILQFMCCFASRLVFVALWILTKSFTELLFDTKIIVSFLIRSIRNYYWIHFDNFNESKRLQFGRTSTSGTELLTEWRNRWYLLLHSNKSFVSATLHNCYCAGGLYSISSGGTCWFC